MSSVYFPTSGLISIGVHAFSNCIALNAVTIPSSVTDIGNNAFYGNIRLSGVIFSTNNVLNSIGQNAFLGCDALTFINFANITAPNWTIYVSAFNCLNLKNVVFGSILPTINSSIAKSTFTTTDNTAYKLSDTPLTSDSNSNLYYNFSVISDLLPNNRKPQKPSCTCNYGNAYVTITHNISIIPPSNYTYSLDGGYTWILCSPAIPSIDLTAIYFTISGLCSGTTYSLCIRAVDLIGDGPSSDFLDFTTTKSTTGPFSTIGTHDYIGINNISNLSINTNCLAFHAPMGVYFTNPNLYAPSTQYLNFNSNKGFTFNAGTTRLATIDNVGSLWCNGLSIIGGGNITCESNVFVLGKVQCSQLQCTKLQCSQLQCSQLQCTQLQLSNSANIVSIRCINFHVGGSNNGTGTYAGGIKKGNEVPYGVTYTDKTKLFFTITFNNNTDPPPSSAYTAYNYIFSATIAAITTTNMIFHVIRLDNNSDWANDLIAQIIITEIA